MNEHLPGDDAGVPRPTSDRPTAPPTDPLAERIARSMRSREVLAPDPAQVAARVEAQLAARTSADRAVTRLRGSRGVRIAAAGVVTSTLAVAGAGAAAAGNPYSPMARTVENVAQAVGLDWTAMPDGYTRAQHDAFWAAGYESQDLDALQALWGTDLTETKARAGQMLLDGQPPPVAPGSVPADEPPEQLDALWDAGYRYDDAVALAELWGVDVVEAKARAALDVVEGRALPLPPSGPAEEPGAPGGADAPGPVTGGEVAG